MSSQNPLPASPPCWCASSRAHARPGTPIRVGQTLYVVSGSGLAQSWGGEIKTIRAGDTVWFPPGEKHWHGAGPNNVMEHVAMQESLDGKHVEWLEKVSDEQYAGAERRTTPA